MTSSTTEALREARRALEEYLCFITEGTANLHPNDFRRELDAVIAAALAANASAHALEDGKCVRCGYSPEHCEPVRTESGDAPEGPWRSETLNDRNRAWGPCVWDSRVCGERCEKGGYVWGRSIMAFDDLVQAEEVRDALNRHAAQNEKDDQ